MYIHNLALKCELMINGVKKILSKSVLKIPLGRNYVH